MYSFSDTARALRFASWQHCYSCAPSSCKKASAGIWKVNQQHVFPSLLSSPSLPLVPQAPCYSSTSCPPPLLAQLRSAASTPRTFLFLANPSQFNPFSDFCLGQSPLPHLRQRRSISVPRFDATGGGWGEARCNFRQFEPYFHANPVIWLRWLRVRQGADAHKIWRTSHAAARCSTFVTIITISK